MRRGVLVQRIKIVTYLTLLYALEFYRTAKVMLHFLVSEGIWGALLLLPITLFSERGITSSAITHITVGYLMLSVLGAAVWIGSFEVRRSIQLGTLENFMLCGAHLYDIVLSQMPIAMLFATATTALFVAVAYAVTGTAPAVDRVDLPHLLAGVVGLVLIAYGYAAVIAYSLTTQGSAGPILELLNWVLAVASGALIPAALLPQPIKTLALALPFAHVADSLRYALLEDTPLAINPSTLVYTAIALPAAYALLGTLALVAAEHKILKEGVIELYRG